MTVDNRDIISEEIEFVETNLYSNPKKCAKILAKVDPEELCELDAAFFYKQKGLQALNNGEYFKAYLFVSQSIETAKSINYQHLIDAGHINLSAIYYYTKQYKKAIDNAFIASRSKNKVLQSLAFQNLGSYYELTKDYDQAMIYNKKSIELAKVLESADTSFAGLINSGNIMLQLNKKNEALPYFKSALEIVEGQNLKLYYSDAYVFLAGYYNHFSEFENAIKHAKSALKYTEEFNVLRNYPNIYYILINSYFHQKDIEKAKYYLDQFFKIDQEESDIESQTKIYNLQIEIAKQTAGAESALKAAMEKIAFLERKDELSKKQLELYRKFKEDENEKIEESRIKLAQSNEQLVNIAKILAHDIKTPVRTLGSFSELLKKELEPVKNPTANEYLDFITDAAVNLYSKLDSALSLVLLELKRPLEVVDINEKVDKLKSRFPELEIIVPKALPKIKSNENLIGSLLFCLFQNAQDYNSKAKQQLTIGSKKSGDQIKLYFEDNGDGIPKEEVDKVFDIFYTSQPNQNKGIGLSVCKKICELHNGSIKLKSKFNKGTKVIVELPVKQ